MERALKGVQRSRIVDRTIADLKRLLTSVQAGNARRDRSSLRRRINH